MSALPELPDPDEFDENSSLCNFSFEALCEYGDARAAHARKAALEEAAEAPFTLDVESYGVLPIRASIIISDCVKAIRSLK